jgi:hypothetical protein
MIDTPFPPRSPPGTPRQNVIHEQHEAVSTDGGETNHGEQCHLTRCRRLGLVHEVCVRLLAQQDNRRRFPHVTNWRSATTGLHERVPAHNTLDGAAAEIYSAA